MDEESATYDDWQSPFGKLYAEVSERISRHLHADDNLIEIGCGTGIVTFELAQGQRLTVGVGSDGDAVMDGRTESVGRALCWVRNRGGR